MYATAHKSNRDLIAWVFGYVQTAGNILSDQLKIVSHIPDHEYREAIAWAEFQGKVDACRQMLAIMDIRAREEKMREFEASITYYTNLARGG